VRVENGFGAATRCSDLSVRLLGTPAVLRGADACDLPASRKVRMLLAYLAMAGRPVARTQLCDLLWDGPNDPRGELRWCLTKLRRLLDTEDRVVVQANADHVGLSLHDAEVDALEVQGYGRRGLESLGVQDLETLAGRFSGSFLEGMQADRAPAFESWLAGQRRHFRALQVEVLARLGDLHAAGTPGRLHALERRAVLSPDDAGVHMALLSELAAQRDLGGGDAHLAATVRYFEAEGLDAGPLRTAWRSLRQAPCTIAVSEAPPQPAAATLAAAARTTAEAVSTNPERRRPRVAILPPAAFAPASQGLADAIAHDVIGRLARLRSVAVIAWGSVSALVRRNLTPDEAGAALRADYLASGVLSQSAGGDRLQLELVETATQVLVWSETFELARSEGLIVLDRVGSAIVASLTHAVEIAERERALVKSPGSLTAWETYHRGLWHMYQFTEGENRLAQAHFREASTLDPTFSRAYAGISFTHWQNAFQRWGDPQEETAAAYAAASRSLLVDDLDPLAHWAMGRALWLKGSHGEGLAELRRAVDISPSFSLGHYAIAFVQAQSGDPGEAIQAAEQSRQLSPYDPMLFGTYGALAMANARLGDYAQAADWALLAAAQPNAHRIILAIAAHCLALAGRMEDAIGFAARLKALDASYTTRDFLQAFHFSADGRRLFALAGQRLGLA
jgi:DNA-binding SARP family transcriptional activator